MIKREYLISIILLVVALRPSTCDKIKFPNPKTGEPDVELDVEALVHNDTFVKQQFRCLIKNIDCDHTASPIIGDMFKKAILGHCDSCTPEQKEAYSIMGPVLNEKYPSDMGLLTTMIGVLNKPLEIPHH